MKKRTAVVIILLVFLIHVIAIIIYNCALKPNEIKIEGSGNVRTITYTPIIRKHSTLRLAVWSNTNGQDDLKWHSMRKTDNGSWTAEFEYLDFKGSGTATIHIYEENKFVGEYSFQIPHEDWLNAQADRFKAEFLHGTNPYANIDYIQCAINIAQNDYYGYGHTWRSNRHTLSCAGLVGLCLTYCGYGDFIKDDPPGEVDGTRWGYIDLGTYSGKYDWKDIMINEVGATWHSGLDGIEAGDILYYDTDKIVNHTGFYLGNGMSVEARAPLKQPSLRDDTGEEIGIFSNAFSKYKWEGYFRLPRKNIAW